MLWSEPGISSTRLLHKRHDVQRWGIFIMTFLLPGDAAQSMTYLGLIMNRVFECFSSPIDCTWPLRLQRFRMSFNGFASVYRFVSIFTLSRWQLVNSTSLEQFHSLTKMGFIDDILREADEIQALESDQQAQASNLAHETGHSPPPNPNDENYNTDIHTFKSIRDFSRRHTGGPRWFNYKSR